jgi:tetratricopeptide (TPR) repeat protein
VQINEIANHLVAAGRLQAAYDQYKNAVQIKPDLAVAWNNLGVVCAALGKIGEAESAYNRAIRVKDDYALARYNLGVLYDNQGKYDPAIEQYQRAIELDPGLLDVRRNPQVASNRHLAAVLVKSYLDRGGSVLLPVESALPPQPSRKKRGS